MLRKRRDVRADQIGVLGISRGGWYGPLAASLSDDVAFLILLVPPAVTPAEQETRSRLDQMRAAGFEPATIELARDLLAATWRWLQSLDNWEEYARLRAAAVDAGVPDYVLESNSPDESEWLWGRMNMFFDPCPVLRKLEIPILAIFGSADLHVNEQVNRERLEECVNDAATLTVRTIEGAGHNLAISNDLPIHRQTGRGDEGFSILADWTLVEMKNGK